MNSYLDKFFGIIVGLFLLTISGYIIYWMITTTHSIGEIIGISFWVLILFVFGVAALTTALFLE